MMADLLKPDGPVDMVEQPVSNRTSPSYRRAFLEAIRDNFLSSYCFLLKS
jgi:hypothetical protein